MLVIPLKSLERPQGPFYDDTWIEWKTSQKGTCSLKLYMYRREKCIIIKRGGFLFVFIYSGHHDISFAHIKISQST